MERGTQINFWYFVLALLGIVLLRDLWVESQSVETIAYSEFERLLNDGQIEDGVVGSEMARDTFREPHNGNTRFVTRLVDPAVAEQLSRHGIT